MHAVFTYSDMEDYTLEEAYEAELIARAKEGDAAAADRLILAYGPAIRSAVSEYKGGVYDGQLSSGAADYATPSFALEDAQQAAILGVLEAIREHDATKNPRLAGTLRRRVNRELTDEGATRAAFRIPDRMLSRFFGIMREAEGDFDKALALAPSRSMSRDAFRAIYDATGAESLPTQDEEDDERAPRVGRPLVASSPVVDVEDRILVDAAFSALDDEEARIVELSYGFTGYEPLPDGEVAHRVGLTRPTAQRRRANALDKMRKELGVTLGIVEDVTPTVSRRRTEGGEVRTYASGIEVEVADGRKTVSASAGVGSDGRVHRAISMHDAPYAACEVDRSRLDALNGVGVAEVECSECRKGL